MNAGLYLALGVVALIIISVAQGVRQVPQGNKWVVERLGKFKQCLSPGLNFIIPYVDKVAYRLTTKDIVLDIPSQEVITKDNAILVTNAVAYINILSPEKAVYGVEDYNLAIRTLVQTSLRSILGEMSLDEALSSRDYIKSKLKNAISEDIADWGITLKTVEIQDINPSETMQQAMEEQASAERQRRATVTRADGDKQAAILQAEGELEVSRKQAEAQIILAESSKKSIEFVTQAIGDRELPVTYLLGEKYIQSLNALSTSDNAKSVIFPADIPSAINGLMGKK